MIKQVEFKTSFYKEDLFTKFKIKQDDTLIMKVEIEDMPANFKMDKARLLLRRNDKTVIYEEINVIIEDKTITFTAPNGTTQIAGTTYGELEFSDDETYKSSTFVFVFDVVNRSANINEAIESKDEIFIIKEIRDFINQTKEDLMKINEETTNLKGVQDLLNNKMEDTVEKVEELIHEVERRDLNVEELKIENERAENNIADLSELCVEAEVIKENVINEITEIKNNTINDVNELKDNTINEIEELKEETIDDIEILRDDSINDIEDLRDDSIRDITTLNEESIKNIDQLKENSINLIIDEKDNVLNEIDNTLNDFINISENTKGELIKTINEGKNVKAELNNEIEAGTNLLTNINITIQSAEETNMSLSETIQEAEETEEDLNNLNKETNSLKNALYTLYDEAFRLNNVLSNTTDNASKKDNELRTLLNESIAFKTNLDKVLQDLESENIRAEENIEELEILHPQSDIRIETLRALIEEAKKYEEVVRRWIDKNGDGNIATEEVLLALETLKASVEEINLRFENYYTKEEINLKFEDYYTKEETYTKEEVNNLIVEVDTKTDEAIEIANEALEKAVYTKGEIGVADYSILPSHVKESIEANIETLKGKLNPSSYGNIIGYTVWKARYQSYDDKVPTEEQIIDSARYLLTIYTDKIGSLDKMKWYKALDRGKCYEIKYKDTITSTQFMYGVHTFNYTESTDTWGGKFELVSNLREAYVSELYYSDVPIYKDSTVAEIHKNIYDPSIPPKISDFNNAIENGAYKADVSEAEAVDLYNVPIEGALKGVLVVDSYGDITKQTYSRYNEVDLIRTRNGSEWSEWKSSNAGADIDFSVFATKEEVSEIKKDIKLLSSYGNIQDALNTEFDELPETTFKDYPANPDVLSYPYELKMTHHGYHMIFYFPYNPEGKFGIVFRDDGKLGLKLIDNSFSYTEYLAYYRSKNATSGSWTAMSNNNHFTNPASREINNIYYHNFNIVNADNPLEVVKIGEGCSLSEDIVSDFNRALEYKEYKVISTGGNIINTPIQEPFNGVLKVSNLDNHIILQELTSDRGEVYTRIFNTNAWTEWSVSGGGSNIDLSSYITTEQLEEAINNIETISENIIDIYNETVEILKGGM